MIQQQNDHHRRQLTRGLAIATTAVLTALALGTGPAAARPDAGQPIARAGDTHRCVLARVGTQYVKCDVNTGNGVPAPGWVPER